MTLSESIEGQDAKERLVTGSLLGRVVAAGVGTGGLFGSLDAGAVGLALDDIAQGLEGLCKFDCLIDVQKVDLECVGVVVDEDRRNLSPSSLIHSLIVMCRQYPVVSQSISQSFPRQTSVWGRGGGGMVLGYWGIGVLEDWRIGGLEDCGIVRIGRWRIGGL